MASGVQKSAAKKALNYDLYSTRDGGSHLYIPLAVHKNELVVIDGMESFSHYFCLAKKQKMTPLVTATGRLKLDDDLESEGRVLFDECTESGVSGDEDDEL